MGNQPSVILLIEADEPLAQVITSYLERDGYRVQRVDSLTAADGGGAAGGPLELLLLDADGFDAGADGSALEGLQWRHVILLASDRAALPWARGSAGVTVLDKPFAMRQLRQRVAAALPARAGENRTGE